MSRSPLLLEDLFTSALELPPEERAAFVDQACRGEPALRRELEELLAADNPAVRYFDELSGAIVNAASVELESAVQTRVQIGPYRAFQVIGRGGMGVVYRAERVDGEFDQQVALKLLHLDMETPQIRARFLAERQLLAGLSHPLIARLLDGGVTDEGRPYFVMELVDGMPIARYCREQALGVEKILRLFLDVVEAVGYLHRNLIVHRDLKPGNIFVDRDGQVKLLDFGIAKLLADDPALAGRTRTGQQMLTPEYAAPEQLTGAPVTTATDVYALGGVLYELLAGRRPFEQVTSDLAEVRHRVPTPPSAASANSAVPRRRLAGDLDTICLKALRPEPEHRYASAEQLGQDIDRHLEGLPVRARKSTLSYRASRFVSRHRRAVGIALALLALLTIGLFRERGLRGEAEVARLEADREAKKAEKEADKAVAVSDFLRDLFSSVDPAKAQGREVTVAEVLDQASQRLDNSADFADQPTVEAAVRLTVGNTYQALSKFDESKAHLERAVELEGGRQANTPEALAAIEALSFLLFRQTEHAEAEPLARHVFEARSRTLGEDHPETLKAISQLANTLWAQGRYDEVEPLDRKTLEVRRRVLGEDHPDTLRSMNGLAATLHNTARYTEAAELFRQVLAGQERLQGDSHPDTLNAGNNLAACYLELGRYPEGEKILRRVLEGRLRILGEEDPLTWTSMHNLGQALALQALYPEAETILRRAASRRRSQIESKRNYFFTRSYLADTVRNQGRLNEAESIYLETLEEQRQRFGSGDPETLKTASGMAELRLRQGRLGEAEALITEVVGSIADVVGDRHPDLLEGNAILAKVRNAQERHDEALELADQVIEMGTTAFDAEHPLVLEAQVEKVLALRGLRRIEEASALAPGIYEARVRRLGTEHPQTLQSRSLVKGIEPSTS